ncbi:hypothetical protein AOLI_G00162130 [Acnodon oligacanthus]
MTVNFLKQQSHDCLLYCSHAGYSRCVQEAVFLLSQCGVQTPSQRRRLSHFLTMQPSMEKSTRVLKISSLVCHISSKEETPAPTALWRPC